MPRHYLNEFEIEVPADPAILEEYLELGWYQLNDPPRLKWSFPRGSPRHPGQPTYTPVDNILTLLDVSLLDRFQRYLPWANNFEGDRIQACALLSVTFQKEELHQRRFKSAPPIATWKPVDAELTVLPIDDGTKKT